MTIIPIITPPQRTKEKEIKPEIKWWEISLKLFIGVAKKILNKTIAVASLKILSPSTNVTRRFGALSSLNNAMTATGSVAEINAPNKSAPLNDKEVTNPREKPINPAEIIIPITANNKIGIIFLNNKRILTLIAASKINVGSIKNKIALGDNSSLCSGSKIPICCDKKANNPPIITKPIEYGNLILLNNIDDNIATPNKLIKIKAGIKI